MKKLTLLALLTLIISTSFVLRKKDKVFTMKKFEKRMAMVQPNLYACKYEVSNFEYQEFLKHLNQNKATEQLKIARIHGENWASTGGENSPFIKTYEQHPAYHNYPVVNISHEGATLFCKWLTNTYNQTEGRKFQKVKFRLPSKEEWKHAARAGHKMAPFPWGGYYLRNADGQILANYYRIPQTALKAKKDENGELVIEKVDPIPYNTTAHITAPVESYLPSDYGIFHMSGNVAEMLDQPGSTKGGSWASSGYYITIDAEDEFARWEEPSPKIGFRYFMEVIEE